MKHTTLHYRVPTKLGRFNNNVDLRENKELSDRLTSGITAITTRLGRDTDQGKPSVTMDKGTNGHSYVVHLSAPDAGRLYEDVQSLVKKAGSPDFVMGSYDLVDTILRNEGKKLKRKVMGSLMGKHVVDLK
jgi:hypothetical protein